MEDSEENVHVDIRTERAKFLSSFLGGSTDTTWAWTTAPPRYFWSAGK